MRVTFLTGAALALVAATPVLALLAGFKAKADALLARSYDSGGPGVSVVISERGKIVYQGTRGLADIAARRPVTSATVFRMGSITKQFASAVVLQLAAEGKLKLSDPLSKFVPHYPGGEAITVKQLLNHTSGIQSYTNVPGWMGNEANTNRTYTTAQMIALFKDLPAPSKPGVDWSYNNSGYILVGAAIEAVEHKPWHQVVAERIVRPLGLSSIRYGVGEDKVAGMAKGYTDGDSGPIPARLIHMSVPGAAGALIGTPADLAKWGNALHHGKVVPAAYYQQMIAPTTMPDGTTAPYGFALEPGTLRGQPSIGHSGGIFGFSTGSMYIPSDDLFVAVFANSDQPQSSSESMLRRLAAMVMGKPFDTFTEAKVDPAAVKPLLGVYRFADAQRAFFERDGKLFTRRDEGPESQVFATTGNRFFYGGDELSWFAIARGEDGKLVYQRHANGEDAVEPGTWVGPIPAVAAEVSVPAAILASYAGSYSSPMGKIIVADAGGKLTVQLAGQPALPLKAVAADQFEVAVVGAKVKFVGDGGKIVRL